MPDPFLFGSGGALPGAIYGDQGNNDLANEPLDFEPGPAPPGYIWVQVPSGFNDLGQPLPPTWSLELDRSDTGDGPGSQLSYQLGLSQLAEDIRANKAREEAMARQRALDAATSALSSYLRGTELADARRLSAFQESRQLLPFLTSPDQQYFAGHEPGGLLATAARNYGLPFTGTEIQHKELVPASLAVPPTNPQIGQGILDEMEVVRAQGNQR